MNSMRKIKKGDIVGRISYGKDIFFIVEDIINLNKKEIALDNTIIGEVVNIETEGSKEKEHVTKVQIITPSSHRVKPVCPVYLKCGGCSLQHLEYAEQLNLKTRLIESLYTPFKVKIEPAIGKTKPNQNRKKSQKDKKIQKGIKVKNYIEERL